MNCYIGHEPVIKALMTNSRLMSYLFKNICILTGFLKEMNLMWTINNGNARSSWEVGQLSGNDLGSKWPFVLKFPSTPPIFKVVQTKKLQVLWDGWVAFKVSFPYWILNSNISKSISLNLARNPRSHERPRNSGNWWNKEKCVWGGNGNIRIYFIAIAHHLSSLPDCKLSE